MPPPSAATRSPTGADLSLGIEIGGTKLQFGIGRPDSRDFVHFERRTIDPQQGAAGIQDQIAQVVPPLIDRFSPVSLGLGFGGPVNAANGVIIRSHQVAGWENFPIVDWLQRQFQRPAAVDNDCDVAALAEARLGAGRDQRVVLYVTVGSGVGGGLVVGGNVYRGTGPASTEIGHLRPGTAAVSSAQTVEAIASGWGIAAAARAALVPHSEAGACLLRHAEGHLDRITAQCVAQAADEGNELALGIMRNATNTLGWAIGQAITLLSPQVIIIGGGVAMGSDPGFWTPLREAVARYVMPILRDTYVLVPAAFGEEVVVRGALMIAADATA